MIKQKKQITEHYVLYDPSFARGREQSRERGRDREQDPEIIRDMGRPRERLNPETVIVGSTGGVMFFFAVFVFSKYVTRYMNRKHFY